MSQGLFTAVSGIASAQAKLNVIADNIANMNTVAFKSNQVTFENIYSRTLSTGSAPLSNVGGTNPMQIGLGVQIGEISKSFQNGTVQSTGRTTDFNIQGNGFFSFTDPDGVTKLSRAGNFSLDSEGNMVNSQGYKVSGTDTVFSSAGSGKSIKIPTALNLSVEGNDATPAKEISALNDASISMGTFDLTLTYDDGLGNPNSVGPHTNTFTIASGDTVQDLVDSINSTYLNIPASNNQAVSASIDSEGKFSLAFKDNVGASDFTMAGGSSNFLTETRLASTVPDTTTTANTTIYTSKILDYKATIDPSDSSSDTKLFTSFAVSEDGSIEATYANGDKVSVITNGNTKELIYTTSTGVIINNADISVNGGALEAANLQLQMINVINPKGLIAEGGNMFSLGVNAGDPSYTIGRSNGVGGISSGGLESSNVDLPTEFAEMILSQRTIEASSRAFDAQNQILRQLISLGR